MKKVIVIEDDDTVVYNDIIAVKLWSADDMKKALSRQGYRASEMNVKMTIGHDHDKGLLTNLETERFEQEQIWLDYAVIRARALLD